MKIENYEGLYSIYPDGRVWSIRNSIFRKSNTGKRGYPYVTLHNNGSRKTCKIHRLVAKAFIPNPESKPEVNHINGIKTDNRVENLEWVTVKENHGHAARTGLRAVGERSGMAKLTEPKVREIKKLYASGGYFLRELAVLFGVGKSTISYITKGERWGHLK